MHLSIRQRRAILIALLSLTALIILSSSIVIHQNGVRISSAWEAFDSGPVKKVQLLSDMRDVMGYGGAIHQFKNMILRGEIALHDAIKAKIDRLERFATDYRTLGITAAEEEALREIEATFAQYTKNADLAVGMIREGQNVQAIDHIVRIDDRSALAALDVLDREFQRNWATYEKGVQDGVDTILESVVAELVLVVFCLGFMIASTIWYIQAYLIEPVTRLRGVMGHLAEGDTEVSVPMCDRRDEIGDMARTVQVFKENLIARKAAEAELREREKQVWTIMEATPIPLFISRVSDGEIIYANNAVREVYGYTKEQVIGLKGVEFYQTPSDREEVITRLRREGYVRNYETKVKRANGTLITALLSVAPIIRKGEEVLLTGVIDVSPLREAEQQLVQATKMEAIGQLTGGVAHDFNNLLTVVLGNIQLVERKIGDDPALAKWVTRAKEATLNGSHLTKQLLAFSRRQVLEPEVLDVNTVIHQTLDLIRPTLGETIEVDFIPDKNSWPVEIDPHQFESALLNLAVNARDAMPDGGHLLIETSNAHLDEVYARHNLESKAGDYTLVVVSDTGCGIPEHLINRIVEPFFTTKETGKGTGLGLSMIYGFVKQSNGHFKIYSEEGNGTCVKMYFPRAHIKHAAVDKQTLAGNGHIAKAKGEHVLVVEDALGVRETVADFLEENAYRVYGASNGPEAIRLLEEISHLDLLFTDVVMPGGMDGPAVAQKVREKFPDLKVLFTSGYTGTSFLKNWQVGKNEEFIGKPYQHEMLAEKLRYMLEAAS
ncbi:MAG: PAS domain S-box protein [Alphaproteobacteria bacterium]|nr:PAS domain S-box protein [Alphaproteobacteria bacterium]